MTKPRTRTQKIHRKRRGPRRGFKSRSQRGGWFWESNQPVTNTYGTESKKGLFDGWFGNDTTKPVVQFETYNPMQQPPMQPYQPTANSLSMGGRKRCKRHHKHSRRCKK